MAFLDENGVLYLWNKIKANFAGKGEIPPIDEATTSKSGLMSKEDKAKLDGIADSADVSLVQEVKVNGTALTPDSNKAVDITVPTTVASLSDASNYALASSIPTNVSDLTNDAGYQTASDVATAISTSTSDFQTQAQVEAAINSAIAGVYKYKGSVANRAALPASGQESGDVYNLEDTGMNVAWNGTEWDDLGMSLTITAITNQEIDTICQ